MCTMPWSADNPKEIQDKDIKGWISYVKLLLLHVWAFVYTYHSIHNALWYIIVL